MGKVGLHGHEDGLYGIITLSRHGQGRNTNTHRHVQVQYWQIYLLTTVDTKEIISDKKLSALQWALPLRHHFYSQPPESRVCELTISVISIVEIQEVYQAFVWLRLRKRNLAKNQYCIQPFWRNRSVNGLKGGGGGSFHYVDIMNDNSWHHYRYTGAKIWCPKTQVFPVFSVKRFWSERSTMLLGAQNASALNQLLSLFDFSCVSAGIPSG